MELGTVLNRRTGGDRRIGSAFVYTGPERRKLRDRRSGRATVCFDGGNVYGAPSCNKIETVEGDWSGRITGTNNANVSMKLYQDKATIHGLARINAPAYKPSAYNLCGMVEGDTVKMNLILDKDFGNQTHAQETSINSRPGTTTADTVRYGDITVNAKIVNDRAIEGKWYSTVGTNGNLTLTNGSNEASENQIDYNDTIQNIISKLTK